MNKKLYRVENDRMIAGVCGGIAEYFNLDASFVRIGFAFFALFGGSGILLYVIMWAVVPPKSKVT
jgi:phage shock protein C